MLLAVLGVAAHFFTHAVPGCQEDITQCELCKIYSGLSFNVTVTDLPQRTEVPYKKPADLYPETKLSYSKTALSRASPRV